MKQTILTLAAVIFFFSGSLISAQIVVIGTDFENSVSMPRANSVADANANGLTAGTLSNITYTLNGASDPGDISPTIVVGNAAENRLNDNMNASGGFLAVTNNVGNGGMWEFSLFSTITTNVEITGVNATQGFFSNNTFNQGNNLRDWQFTVELIEVESGIVLSSVVNPTAEETRFSHADRANHVQELTFGRPINLTAGTNVEFKFLVERGSIIGVNAGFDEINIIGNITEILLGDVNRDGVRDFSDIAPFISVLSAGGDQLEADIDMNQVVNFSDIAPFIQLLLNGS